MNNQKLAWYILDEIAVMCSSKHIGRDCPICDRAVEAMKLLEKPTPDECNRFYKERILLGE
ncbi:MAG: hypothetical protein WC516_08040 [Patescibacteria group bacterium]|jgi:hypothetical protein